MKTKIWSTRWTAAKGNHFVMERECDEADAQAWLKIFRDDEPNVCFFAHHRKPSSKRNAGYENSRLAGKLRRLFNAGPRFHKIGTYREIPLRAVNCPSILHDESVNVKRQKETRCDHHGRGGLVHAAAHREEGHRNPTSSHTYSSSLFFLTLDQGIVDLFRRGLKIVQAEEQGAIAVMRYLVVSDRRIPLMSLAAAQLA